MPATAARPTRAFTAVQTVGGLLPADMLLRIAEDAGVPGTRPAAYGLPSSRAVRDEAERAWEYLKPLWRELRSALPGDPETGAPSPDPTGRAQTDWLAQLFRQLDFGTPTPVGADGIPADSDPAKRFPVSHTHGPALLHQLPWDADLDKRPAGHGSVPPQSMVQECLNRTAAHLWAILTNGRRLRLLRDSSALATASYVEFDLEAVFDGELFNEFLLLYRTVHASRFAVDQNAPPSTCWLEKWRTESINSGARALEQLRIGVQNAVTTLGTGFLRHPDNGRLRDDVRPKELQAALLRLVYRLLFVFVAEDRDALLDPAAGEAERVRYTRYFSSARLREHARRRRGTAHSDLYEALRLVLDALGCEGGRPELGLPGLGGLFTDTDADSPLRGLRLTNEALLTAVRHLAQVRDATARRWRAVDYRHLDAEELGSVYESLLELEPEHSAAERSFALVEVAGNSRKTTGSYYTPSSLIECLLDSTLDPVIDDAVDRGKRAAAAAGRTDPADDIVDALLSLTICDPACGSGHFLVAAARRVAKRVAAVRERNPEPTVETVRHALHEVIARCVYGVDLNPMAVELAKVSLWLEALEPGKALGFLDAHVKHGNALLGATPKLLADGVPDEAFKAIEGDDEKTARDLRKRNKVQRGGQDELLFAAEAAPSNSRYARELTRITAAPSDELGQVRKQEDAYRAHTASTAYMHDRDAADAWCAAFVWPLHPGAPEAPTDQIVRALLAHDRSAVTDATLAELHRLRDAYRFFHWHLEFPEVFTVPESGEGVEESTGWSGGFDAVLGNPPWERVKLQEQEFFAQRSAAIAQAKNAAERKARIAELAHDPDGRVLFAEFGEAKRRAEGESHFLRLSGRYPLTGRGDINTYAVFAESDRTVTGARGRTGIIVPTGIATDATTQFFFKDLVRRGQLSVLFSFENEEKVFPGVHHGVTFCLFSMAGQGDPDGPIRLAFRVRQVTEIPERQFTLTARDIELINPNTGTCPVFRTGRDAKIVLGIYHRIPVLVNEAQGNEGNPWGVSFMTMFHMSNDSHLFRPSAAGDEILEDLFKQGWELKGNTLVRGDKRLLPLYEAKMLHHYDHRLGTYEGQTQAQANLGTLPRLSTEQHDDPSFRPLPRYWVPEYDIRKENGNKDDSPPGEPGVNSRLSSKNWKRNWLIGWRDITSATNERTVIVGAFPRVGVGNNLPTSTISPSRAEDAANLIACTSAFVFDFTSRLKIGGSHLNFFIAQQLPTLTPSQVTPHSAFVKPRTLELTYTAHDMAPFARDLGDTGAPFRWDEERRAVIRAELDALFFHLYGINRDDVSYILDTFPIVKRKDEEKYGTYRTRDLILAEYDRMAAAGLTLDNPLTEGEDGTYASTLTPPPGHGPRHPVAIS